jgi:hypothetical protein
VAESGQSGGRLMSDSACGSMLLHHYSFPFFRAQRGKTETGKNQVPRFVS